MATTPSWPANENKQNAETKKMREAGKKEAVPIILLLLALFKFTYYCRPPRYENSDL